MKTILLALILLLTHTYSWGQFIESSPFQNLQRGSADWGDYDNDGDLDLLLTGKTSATNTTQYTTIYRNNGGSFTNVNPPAIQDVYEGEAEWGDYDGDGDLDILLTGTYSNLSGGFISIYRNDAGVFSAVATTMQTLRYSSVAWGDYDNDGDLDIAIIGRYFSTNYTKIYKNEGSGVFTELTTSIANIYDGDVEWADYDNDKDLDLLISGNSSTRLYKNNGKGIFVEVTTTIQPLAQSALTWGDYDNDGDLDLAIGGTYAGVYYSKIYRNDGGTFVDIAAALPTIAYGDLDWGDYDNDGDLDLFLTGLAKTYLYRNDGGVFTDTGLPFLALSNSSCEWGDYDNDGDLDMVLLGSVGTASYTRLYNNTAIIANQAPTFPTGLTAATPVYGDTVSLSWNAAFDTETSSPGLSYNIRVRRATGNDIAPAMSNMSDGFRRIVTVGNAQLQPNWKLSGLTTGKYYWSVQAIDAGYKGSAFSPEDSFEITNYFTPYMASLGGFFEACSDWGDYDNDGDLDLLMAGRLGSVPTTKIFRNNGTSFTDIGTTITGVYRGDAKWGDYDNDGDLDVVIFGQYSTTSSGLVVSEVWTNTNGVFANAGISLPGISYGACDWGDYDNDGDLDLLLVGNNYLRIHQNMAGVLSATNIVSLTGMSAADASFGDYDNDGDLDIIATGSNVSKLYRNTNGTFVEVITPIFGTSYGSVEWGDYDGDRDLDLLITGSNNAAIYRNNNGSFSMQVTLQGVSTSKGVFGDYDNDGDLDVFVVGDSKTFAYRNDNGVYAPVGLSLPDFSLSTISIADVDVDNDLDILLAGNGQAQLFSNAIMISNTIPTPPTYLTANTTYYTDTVRLNWGWGSDVETPSNALSYNLYLGMAPSRLNKISPMSNIPSGDRRTVDVGEVGSNLSWKLKNLPSGRYYWAVQSIDAAFTGSPFSVEDSFDILNIFDPIVLPGNSLSYSSVDWGDYDGDGDLDYVIMGQNTTGTYETRIYQNMNGAFVNSGASIQGLYYGDVKWGDYDNDGDLDLAVMGQYAASLSSCVTTIYKNNGGNSFTAQSFTLNNATRGSLDWGDYDNDGDLDLLMTGYSHIRIFVNNNGAFLGTNSIFLTSISDSDANFGDYDNDGDLDILVTGSGVTYLYRNTNGLFAQVSTPIIGTSQGSVDWGDYDNDGDLDVLITGSTYNRIYKNNGGVFALQASLQNMSNSEGVWGDYDNDGDLDALMIGSTSSALYENVNGSFVAVAANLPILPYGDAAWGDYDNDGDLDILLTGGIATTIYENNRLTANSIPSVPTNLSAPLYTYDNTITLSWNKSTDLQTPQNGLSYNLYLGSAANPQEVHTPQSLIPSGYRKIVKTGGTNHANTWTFKNLDLGWHYWAVQAIDHAFAGSPFSARDSFKVIGIRTNPIASPICGGDTILVGFTLNHVLPSNTTFIAQLSNAAGNFNTPTNIGSLITNTSGTIAAIIPPAVANGTGYRIRVIAVSPSIIGTDNGTNLTLYTQPSSTVTASGATTFCQGNGVWLYATAYSGASYQWERNGVSLAGATSTSYYANQSGNYRIRLSINGCENISNAIAVTVHPYPVASILPSGPNVICQGDSIALTTVTLPGATYVWKQNGLIVGTNSSVFFAKLTGNYTVEVTQNACLSVSSAVTVSVSPYPVATISANGSTTICQGGSVVLSTTSYPGAVYQWRKNGANISGANLASYTATSDGLFTVSITLNGCTSTSTVGISVTVVSPPTAIANGGTSFCQGGTVLLSTATGAASYQWLFNGNAIPGATTNLYSANQTGAFSVRTLQNGCLFTSSPINVTVSPLPTTTITTANNSICQGDSSLLSVFANPTYSYQWKRNGVNIMGANANQYFASLPGNYSVEVVASTGCAATSNLVSLTVLPLPSNNLTVVGNSSFCLGGSAVLQVPSGNNYQWFKDGNLLQGANNAQLSVSNQGAYYAVVTGANGCSAPTADTFITVFSLPVVAIHTNTGGTAVCQGDTLVLHVTPMPTYTYQWRLNNTNISGATNSSWSAMQSGTYVAVVTDQNSCLATSNSLQISINPLPLAEINETSPIALCQGDYTILNANVATNLLYQWYLDGAILNNANGNTYAAYSPGFYVVQTTNPFGCTAYSLPIELQINPLPALSFSLPKSEYCQNEHPVALNASPAGGAFYGDGVSNGIFIPSNAQSGLAVIYYAYTDANYCSDTILEQVIVRESPDADFSYQHLCADNTLQLSNTTTDTSLIVNQYEWFYDGVYGGAVTSPNVVFAADGMHQVTLVAHSVTGCSDTTEQLVEAYWMPQAGFMHSDTATYGEMVSLNNTSLFASDFSWNISNGDFSSVESWDYAFPDTGSYVITLIASNAWGCSDTALASVVILPSFPKDYELVLYPNPNNGHFFINLHLETIASVDVRIFNELGQYVQDNTFGQLPQGFNVLEISLQPHLVGVYFVGVYLDGELVGFQPFDNGYLQDKPVKNQRYRKIIVID